MTSSMGITVRALFPFLANTFGGFGANHRRLRPLDWRRLLFLSCQHDFGGNLRVGLSGTHKTSLSASALSLAALA